MNEGAVNNSLVGPASLGTDAGSDTISPFQTYDNPILGSTKIGHGPRTCITSIKRSGNLDDRLAPG